MPTMRDVAKLANVSVATVSSVITGSRPVSDELKTRVLKAMDEIGYKVDKKSPMLNKTIGYIVPSITSPTWARVLKGVHDVGYSRGYQVIICNQDLDSSKCLEYQEFLVQQGVSGVLISSGHDEETIEAIQNLRRSRIPFVIIGAPMNVEDTILVTSDRQSGTKNAARYLFHLGYSRVAVISKTNSHVMTVRMEGIEEAQKLESMANCEVDCKVYWANEFSRSEGERIAAEIIADSEFQPDAIFSLDEIFTLGVLDYFYRKQIIVPDDMPILTVGDNYSDIIKPELTAVAMPCYEMGWRETELLIRAIDGDIIDQKQIYLSEVLTVRRSTIPKSSVETRAQRAGQAL